MLTFKAAWTASSMAACIMGVTLPRLSIGRSDEDLSCCNQKCREKN